MDRNRYASEILSAVSEIDLSERFSRHLSICGRDVDSLAEICMNFNLTSWYQFHVKRIGLKSYGFSL